MKDIFAPAYADLLDEGIRNSVRARKHLEWMREHEPLGYARLMRQWAEAEHRREKTSAAIIARANDEWNDV